MANKQPLGEYREVCEIKSSIIVYRIIKKRIFPFTLELFLMLLLILALAACVKDVGNTKALVEQSDDMVVSDEFNNNVSAINEQDNETIINLEPTEDSEQNSEPEDISGFEEDISNSTATSHENKYDWVEEYSEGLAVVHFDSYDNTENKYRDDDHGWVSISDPGKFGFIDENGQEIIPLSYDWAFSFSEGLAAVNIGGVWIGGEVSSWLDGGKWGFIDRTGQIVVPIIYDFVKSFSDGLAAVAIGEEGHVVVGLYWNSVNNAKWGFINKSGEVVLPIKYDYVESFSDGLANFRVGSVWNGKWGLIDKTGIEIASPKYDELEPFSEGLAKINIGAMWLNGEDFDFLAGGKWGLIDKTGKEIVHPKYDVINEFSEGLAAVLFGAEWTATRRDYWGNDIRTGGKWGFIDMTGKEIIIPKYDSVEYFSDGLAAVCIDAEWEITSDGDEELISGKWGFIDKAGKEVISPKYDAVESFSRGSAQVKLNGTWIFIDKNGQEVV
ncbi:MAG: WG repeat-containing protein [Firmicutes bacterium]|nr:WG repeat-containing protein [Bacillota bacterium]